MFNEKIPPFGGWDGKGCTTVLTGPISTICECYHFGTYAVLAEMIEPPGYPDEWDWLEIVANVGYGVSIFSLVLFTMGIIFKRSLLTDMFYILRLSFAGSYLVGLISMWVADLTMETILLDRHNNIAIAALQQYWYQVAALCLLSDSTAMFRAVTGGVIGGKTSAYLPISFGLPLINLGKTGYFYLKRSTFCYFNINMLFNIVLRFNFSL